MKHQKRARSPSGFTIVEMAAAFSILAVVMVVVAQTAVWSIGERRKTAARQTAVELAENVLQAARSRDWKDLTPSWMEEQKLPKEWQDTFPKGRLTVKIEPEKNLAGVKRVTVVIRWRADAGSIPPAEITMTALFSARSADNKGDKK
jgi:type II secretory pathway pseudopilin PulG